MDRSTMLSSPRRLMSAVLSFVLALGLLAAASPAHARVSSGDASRWTEVALERAAGAQDTAVALATYEWASDDSFPYVYTEAPGTASAGTHTLVMDNSASEFNTHSLTFDTFTEGYNHDVNVNMVVNSGEVESTNATLTQGLYRYYCVVPGHADMWGELVVTGGGGGDTTPPEVSAVVEGEQNDDDDFVGTATVEITATDNVGVTLTQYSLDGSTWQTYSNPVVFNTPGNYNVRYRASDAAGNVSPVGSAPFTVVADEPVDTTPPTVSIAVAGNGTTSATVTVTATDAGSGVATREYSTDGVTFQPYTSPVVFNTPGAYTFRARATDVAGNVSGVQTANFTVTAPADTTPPTVSIAVAGNGTTSATVTVTATDAGSGVATREYSTDGVTFQPYTSPVVFNTPGAYTFRARATDVAGNVSGVQTANFTVTAPADTTPPTVSIAVAGNGTTSATVTVTATDAGSGVATREYSTDGVTFQPYTSPVVFNTPGAYTFRARATDVAGNVSAVQTANFTVIEDEPDDETPPTVSISVAGNGTTSATVTVTATDAGSGVATREYSTNGGTTWQAYTTPVVFNTPGDYEVSARATDVAGNVSAVQTAEFTVIADEPDDTTPPTVSIAVAGDGTTSATVTVTATDAGSGVATREYSTNGGTTWQAYTTPVVFNTPGAYEVSARATDVAGNVSAVQTAEFTVIADEPDDETPPTVSIAVAGDGTTSATVTVTATDAGSGVATREYSTNGGTTWQAYTAPVVFNTPGAYTVSARATDVAGNVSAVQTANFTVIAPPVDTTDPEVSIAVAGDGTTSATVTVTATDDTGVTSTEYSTNNGSTWQAYTTPVVFNTPGDYTFSARASDAAGNVSDVETAEFTVIADEPDECEDPDDRETVVIGDADSGVPNRVVDGNCTINDLIDDESDWSSRARFVEHVNGVMRDLIASGDVDGLERGRITRAARDSGIGRPSRSPR